MRDRESHFNDYIQQIRKQAKEESSQKAVKVTLICSWGGGVLSCFVVCIVLYRTGVLLVKHLFGNKRWWCGLYWSLTLTVPNPPIWIRFCTHPRGLGLMTFGVATTAEKCAGCSTQQDLPARTMVVVFSAEGDKMQQLCTLVASCCIEPWLWLRTKLMASGHAQPVISVPPKATILDYLRTIWMPLQTT